jgi:uncharacterized protein YndB with AHSA1/START domain
MSPNTPDPTDAPARTVQHATFTIDRTYDAPVAQVFAAWADPKAKARWFVGPDDWERSDHEMDFRIGGRETVSGGPPGGPAHAFEARYQDIVENRRIIYSYDMHIGDDRISVSLATVELTPQGDRTRLVFTEQGAFLDGYDNPAQREEGTRGLLDNLAAALRARTKEETA